MPSALNADAEMVQDLDHRLHPGFVIIRPDVLDERFHRAFVIMEMRGVVHALGGGLRQRLQGRSWFPSECAGRIARLRHAGFPSREYPPPPSGAG